MSHAALYAEIHGHQAGILVALTAEDPDPDELERLDGAISEAVAALDALPPPAVEDRPALAALAQEADRLAQAVAAAAEARKSEIAQAQAGLTRTRESLGGYLPTQQPVARYFDRRG